MEEIINPAIEKYAFEHSKPETSLLKKVREFTMAEVSDPQMLSGPLEGNFLKMIVRITKAKRILELGTYTGYSSLWMAEALPADGSIITCDVSEHNAKIARDFFDRSPHQEKIQIYVGPALESLEKLKQEKKKFDLVFIDADKLNYSTYYQQSFDLLESGGSILVDNTLWSGKVLDPQDPSTKAIHQLNETIVKDERVESLLLTIRDGIQWVRKK